jgi:hypothetical protein
MQFTDRRVRGQPSNKRMLPPAATDHKYSHATGAYLLAQRLTAAEAIRRGWLRPQPDAPVWYLSRRWT